MGCCGWSMPRDSTISVTGEPWWPEKGWKLSIWPIQELQLAACFQELKSQWRHEGAWERPAWLGEHLADDLTCSKIRTRKNRNAKQYVYIHIYTQLEILLLSKRQSNPVKKHWSRRILTECLLYSMLIAVIWVLRYGKKGIPMKECSIRSIATRTPRNLFQQAEAHSTIEALNSLVFLTIQRRWTATYFQW